MSDYISFTNVDHNKTQKTKVEDVRYLIAAEGRTVIGVRPADEDRIFCEDTKEIMIAEDIDTIRNALTIIESVEAPNGQKIFLTEKGAEYIMQTRQSPIDKSTGEAFFDKYAINNLSARNSGNDWFADMLERDPWTVKQEHLFREI